MKILCWVGLHSWRKWGGTRASFGLFRRCTCCGRLQEGFEGRRCIHWVEPSGRSRRWKESGDA